MLLLALIIVVRLDLDKTDAALDRLGRVLGNPPIRPRQVASQKPGSLTRNHNPKMPTSLANTFVQSISRPS